MNFLKTLTYSIEPTAPKPPPEEQQQEEMLPAEPPALRSHALTQLRLARSHARHEHETKPKPISRLGSAELIIPLNLRYLKGI